MEKRETEFLRPALTFSDTVIGSAISPGKTVIWRWGECLNTGPVPGSDGPLSGGEELFEVLKRDPGEVGISGPGFVVSKPATGLPARDV